MTDPRRISVSIFTQSLTIWAAWFVMVCGLPLWAQNDSFEPSVTVGAGLQTNFQANLPTGSNSTNQFSLDHIRLYVSGDVTKNISFMFNTDYTERQ